VLVRWQFQPLQPASDLDDVFLHLDRRVVSHADGA